MKKILLAILLLIALAVQLYGVPYNQEFQVNTYTDGNQMYPALVTCQDDGFIVCWRSYGQDGSDDGVFGQRFNKNGEKVGLEFQVNTYTDNIQARPTLAALSDGGFVVCWESWGQDGSWYGVFGQRFNSNGEKDGYEFQVNSYTDRVQMYPALAAFPDGSFVVCWTSENQDGSLDGVFGQRFNRNGEKIGLEFQVNTYTEGYQFEPVVATLPDSGFIVCWESSEQDGSGGGVYGQLFSSSSEKNGPEFRVNTYTENSQSGPALVVLPNGGFVVCWSSYGQDGSKYGVYGQQFNSNGEKAGTEFQVSTNNDHIQYCSALTVFPNGGFVVCWVTEGHDWSWFGVFGQRFDGNGEKVGSEFQVVNTYAYNNQCSPTLATLLDGGFIVCWDGYSQDESEWEVSNSDVFCKYFLGEPLLHQLSPFSLLSPNNDKSLEIVNPIFIWRQASTIRECYPWELTYDLYIDTDDAFTDPRIIIGIQDTTYRIDPLATGQTYFWKVLAKNIAGDSLWSTETNGFFVSEDAVTSVEEIISENPQSLELLSNYPNPFNPETTIKYTLPAGQSSYHVVIKIVDALGRIVQVLKDTEQSPGLYSIQWNAQDNPSGVYFCVIQAGEFKAVRKMMLMR